MFKSAKWRSDRSKSSALFRLQFHATQVSQLGEKDLVLSLVPADTGKPTAKLEKSEIRDGCCYWESPILETVKLIQDPKTGKIHERTYYFIISTGSFKPSILGEVSVNLAEYAGTAKAASVSLPFKGSNTNVVLHVLIQRLHEDVYQRELEEHDAATIKPEDRSLRRFFTDGDPEESININSTEVSFHEDAKSNPEDRSLRRFFSTVDAEENIKINSNDEKPLRKTASSITEINGNRKVSIGSDITSSSSDSSSGFDTPRELAKKRKNMLMDLIAQNQRNAGWELSLVPVHDSSIDDSTSSPRDVFPKGKSQPDLDDSVEKLKSDIVTLSRKAEVTDLELQTLRKQIVKECRRGQDLSKEVAWLKEEREALLEECEKLKASQKGEYQLEAGDQLVSDGDLRVLLEETISVLNHERDLNLNLRIQLQKAEESNSELLFVVQDLEQMLDQGKMGSFYLPVKPSSGKIPEILHESGPELQGLSDDDEEQRALEEIVKQHSDAKETYMLEQKIMDLCSEIEMYRRDKDELEMQMEQLALDYEILKQENHDISSKLDQSLVQEQLRLQYEVSNSYAIITELEDQVVDFERQLNERSNVLSNSLDTIKELEENTRNLENQLKIATCIKVEKEQQAIQAEGALEKNAKEYADAVKTIVELENQIQSLEDELDKQVRIFEGDLESVNRAKVEQEQRAIRAEEALRLTKWKNANTAERLQDEFKRLALQMQSAFDAKEKVAGKAMKDARELRLIKARLEESLQQAKEELQSFKDDYEVQVKGFHEQIAFKSKQMDRMLTLRAEMDRLTADTASIAEQMESEKDMALVNLQSEVEILRAHCEEMRHALHEDAVEKEILRKEVIQLINELKNKDDGQPMATDRTKADLNGKIKLPEGPIKKRATAMETFANAFFEKVKDVQNKVEELDTEVEELNHSSTTCHEYERRKVDGNAGPDHGSYARIDNVFETSINRMEDYEMESSTVFLKEKNASMEAELQEMQERYSEISLRFAEVEGERQQLVMTLRSMKNAKKS